MDTSIAIVAAGIVGLGYVIGMVVILVSYQGDKVQASILLSGAAGVVFTQLANYHRSAGNAKQITQLDAKLDTTNTKVDDNSVLTDDTHKLVNSRMTQLIETVKKLSETQESLVAANSKAEGITLGRAQVTDTINAVTAVGPDVIAALVPGLNAAVSAPVLSDDTKVIDEGGPK